MDRNVVLSILELTEIKFSLVFEIFLCRIIKKININLAFEKLHVPLELINLEY